MALHRARTFDSHPLRAHHRHQMAQFLLGLLVRHYRGADFRPQLRREGLPQIEDRLLHRPLARVQRGGQLQQPFWSLLLVALAAATGRVEMLRISRQRLAAPSS